MIDEAIFDAEEKMEKAVSVARDDLSGIRTGRANPGMFARVNVEYYGTPTPITQMCSINVPEARMVVIKPYEAGQLRAIEDAIRNSDLGVNPTNDGTIIRVAIPQLTEERRRELVKQAKAKGEDAKVSVRNIRRRAMDDIEKARKFALEKFSNELLAVKDSLDAALLIEAAEVQSYKDGVDLTAKQLASVFDKFNIAEINPVGEKFDPNKHQAISMLENSGEPNTVTSVLQKGYTLNDRVLRPALVMVAK